MNISVKNILKTNTSTRMFFNVPVSVSSINDIFSGDQYQTWTANDKKEKLTGFFMFYQDDLLEKYYLEVQYCVQRILGGVHP